MGTGTQQGLAPVVLPRPSLEDDLLASLEGCFLFGALLLLFHKDLYFFEMLPALTYKNKRQATQKPDHASMNQGSTGLYVLE